jgi:23S rRNA (adenine2503-C2)-methyltransferase
LEDRLLDSSPTKASGLNPAEAKPQYLSLCRPEWAELFDRIGEPKFRGQQVADWIFKFFATSPDEFTNLNRSLRGKLAEQLDWALPEVVSALNSADGSTKLLLKTSNGQLIESVVLRYEGRVSLCVSSQVGCKMACSFCQTGKLGFFRNLSAHEIIAQYLIAAKLVRAEGRRLSHVVFMGMGEPLDNYSNVIKAVQLLTSADGYGLSHKHVTISTSGIAPKIRDLATDARCTLAVSLHAAQDQLRQELMPINRKWDLSQLKDSLLYYQQTTGNKITFEYIMIKDKNCGLRDAKDLVKFLHGFRAKVNLIPFNAHPGLPHARPSDDDIRAFQVYLAERSIAAPVRYSKGLDVSGACGQLAAKTMDTLHLVPARKNVISPPQIPTH